MPANMKCEEIEKLMYLKQDELSQEEIDILQDHLKECKECRKEYEEVRHFLDQAKYENPAIDSRFLEARVVEALNRNQEKRLEKGLKPVRKLILKALSIAAVFFFIIFSIEQLNTVKKISSLEQKLAIRNGTTIKPKGQVLVLNHFYDMDDLKQILSPDLNYQVDLSPIFSKTTDNSLILSILNKGDKKLLQDVLRSTPIGEVILNHGFYGNSQLLNLSFNKK